MMSSLSMPNPAKREKMVIYTCYAMMLVLFAPVLLSLWQAWSDSSDYSHGFLIIPVSLYLAWGKRHHLKAVPEKINILHVVAFAFCLLFFFVFYVGDIAFMTRYFMIFVFASFLIIQLGYDNFSIFLFPLIYLFFMVPLPGSVLLPLSLPMRLFASNVSTFLTKFLGIPIYRTGNILHLPGGILEVAPACSGLRSLVSLLALSALAAYLVQEKMWKKAVCFLVAIPVAIFANIVRVSVSILLYQYVGPETAQGLLHESWGLAVFALSTAIISLFNIAVKKM